ncbi:MAG: hypothetical protein ACEPO8_01005 [Rhodothermaceae bacterium]
MEKIKTFDFITTFLEMEKDEALEFIREHNHQDGLLLAIERRLIAFGKTQKIPEIIHLYQNSTIQKELKLMNEHYLQN